MLMGQGEGRAHATGPNVERVPTRADGSQLEPTEITFADNTEFKPKLKNENTVAGQFDEN